MVTPKVTSAASQVTNVTTCKARQGLPFHRGETDGSGGRAQPDYKRAVSARVPANPHPPSRNPT